MNRIKYLYRVAIFIGWSFSYAQSIDLRGAIAANEDLKGIHVLNISAQIYTITNSEGQFEIPVSVNDTIVLRSVQYEPFQLIVNGDIVKTQKVSLTLNDRINELDEVVVGKILTGNLLSDIENSNVKRDINFYDLGIPGYMGELKTQSERKFAEADSGKFVYYYGIGFAINVHKILIRISGRTTEMKARILLEEEVTCLNRAKAEFSEMLFAKQNIEEHLRTGFFLYASKDEQFAAICDANNNMAMYEFLVQKLVSFDSDVIALKD